MMLANIIDGRKPKTQSGSKTTLIVATPALIAQWAAEIDRHCDTSNNKLTVLRYHSGNKMLSNNLTAIFETFDIILSTYSEVLRSFPKVDYPADVVSEADRKKYAQDFIKANKGPLHQIWYHRIVLDEAQAIKNRLSRTFAACAALKAKHRWIISGTPLQNSVEEIYSYFK